MAHMMCTEIVYRMCVYDLHAWGTFPYSECGSFSVWCRFSCWSSCALQTTDCTLKGCKRHWERKWTQFMSDKLVPTIHTKGTVVAIVPNAEQWVYIVKISTHRVKNMPRMTMLRKCFNLPVPAWERGGGEVGGKGCHQPLSCGISHHPTRDGFMRMESTSLWGGWLLTLGVSCGTNVSWNCLYIVWDALPCSSRGVSVDLSMLCFLPFSGNLSYIVFEAMKFCPFWKFVFCRNFVNWKAVYFSPLGVRYAHTDKQK